ncbi:hypothetical protein B7494_g7070 [Chlorociboria aeruginascens]|nr:hypothetical protein B7494_g7070 [Chlorociboria aeruginascens]
MATQLVPLQEVERLSANVIRVLGGNPGKFTLQGTNTYIVGTGHHRILIDTGEGRPSWIAALRETLQIENATISKAVITHWHHDHQGGIRDLLALFPGVSIYKNRPSDGQLGIDDEQVFTVDPGASLRAVFSPGHTQDHMALILQEEDSMFTGDNVLGHGTAVFEDLATYLSSLAKMKNSFTGRAYPGHGPVIEDGPSRILEYIKHRQLREDQVIQVLKSSKASPRVPIASEDLEDWSSMEIVKVIYKDVPEDLHIPANGGIVQILSKLQKEEKVIKNSTTDRWRFKDRATL